MARRTMLTVLAAGTLWGLAEATLGGLLYQRSHSFLNPVVPSVIGLAVLACARGLVPRAGTSAAIAAIAMLFKFLNAPFFACHLLGIFLLGAAFDATWTAFRGRLRPLIGPAAGWLGFAAFAVVITWAFHYRYWYPVDWAKMFRHVGIAGSLTAMASAGLVPLGHRLGERLRAGEPRSLPLGRWAGTSAAAACAGLWGFVTTSAVLSAWPGLAAG